MVGKTIRWGISNFIITTKCHLSATELRKGHSMYAVAASRVRQFQIELVTVSHRTLDVVVPLALAHLRILIYSHISLFTSRVCAYIFHLIRALITHGPRIRKQSAWFGRRPIVPIYQWCSIPCGTIYGKS